MSRISAALVVLCVLRPAHAQSLSEAETFFELKIRPILANTCFKCHGGDKVNNGLRVDSRAALLKGGESGPALVPGKPADSLLVQAIRYRHEDIKMPPGRRLPNAVADDFVYWVERGAIWPPQFRSSKFEDRRSSFDLRASIFGPRPTHWAFMPVRQVTIPTDQFSWSDQPIDRFIGARLAKEGLHPVGQADKRTRLRRVTFDLIGLPPTPSEMRDFLNDASPGAYAKVVDRLLASPQYGERWGRYWMDVGRYADTAGDNADYPIPEIHLYRDYIIAAFNADMPYDQFVREQLAGDILAKREPSRRYRDQVIATGFLALARRYGTAPYELWPLTLEDVIDTVGQAFMGLTLRCARCHDHKFDPVSTKDYYALYGIFASTQFAWAGGEELASKKLNREHFVPLVPAGAAAPLLRAHEKQVRLLEDEIQRLEKLPRAPKLDGMRAQLRRLLKPGCPDNLPVAYAVQDGAPINVNLQLHGDINQPGTVVARGMPRFLSGPEIPAISAANSGRLELANWLTNPAHPLTARVVVNRIWQHHFGRGLVATPSNFGTRGEPPTHPELLDWLSKRFVACGWSIKTLHRDILLSKTYQLASSDDPGNSALDPSNRWYWRANRNRLDAEAIRDALLAVSGQLDISPASAQPFPPIDSWGWTQHNPFKAVYSSNHRSVYLMTQRLQRHPYLALFDGPDPNTTTAQRMSSTVPEQALYMMNNAFMTDRARGFARRLLSEAAGRRERIELAYALAWSRPPYRLEVDRAENYLHRYRAELTATKIPDASQELEAWTSYCRVLLSANEFVYLD